VEEGARYSDEQEGEDRTQVSPEKRGNVGNADELVECLPGRRLIYGGADLTH
jgi:hypothetical protein